LVIFGGIIRHHMQALAEAKVLHDTAEHGRVLLIVCRGARGDAGRSPTPVAWPRFLPAGHGALPTAQAQVWPTATPGDRRWPVWRGAPWQTPAHAPGRDPPKVAPPVVGYRGRRPALGLPPPPPPVGG